VICQRIAIQFLLYRHSFDIRIDLVEPAGCNTGFVLAVVRVTIEYLARQIACIDRIKIVDDQVSYARTGEVQARGCAQTTGSDQQYLAGGEPPLPAFTDPGETDLAAVAYILRGHDYFSNALSSAGGLQHAAFRHAWEASKIMVTLNITETCLAE